MKKKALSLLLAGALLLGACTGCGDASSGSAGDTAAQEDTSSVVIAMGPTSEPEAGFDPAFGWGAGEHVHEPLIQSTLTVTNTDLTIGYDLATDVAASEDGLQVAEQKIHPHGHGWSLVNNVDQWSWA